VVPVGELAFRLAVIWNWVVAVAGMTAPTPTCSGCNAPVVWTTPLIAP